MPQLSQKATTTSPTAPARSSILGLGSYLLAGLLFGLVLIKSEAASWYRIQEMFRFESFHMFGVIGSAVVTGMISVGLLRYLGIKAFNGEPIRVIPKAMTWKRYVVGGLIFGVGWGLAGVCPGPVFALLGAGIAPMLIVLFSALLGTWLYGALQNKLPH